MSSARFPMVAKDAARPMLPFNRALFIGENGIPAGAYLPMLKRIERDIHCPMHTLDIHESMVKEPTHRNGQPGLQPNWGKMLMDTSDSIRELSRHGRVLCIGHGLGAALQLACVYACEVPGINFVCGSRISHIIGIDPPMLSPITRAEIRLSVRRRKGKWWEHVEEVRDRPSRWDTREEAAEYFANTPPFKDFHPDCQKTMMQHGLRDVVGGGCELVFSPEIQSHILATTPGDLTRSFAGWPVPSMDPVCDVGMYPYYGGVVKQFLYGYLGPDAPHFIKHWELNRQKSRINGLRAGGGLGPSGHQRFQNSRYNVKPENTDITKWPVNGLVLNTTTYRDAGGCIGLRKGIPQLVDKSTHIPQRIDYYDQIYLKDMYCSFDHQEAGANDHWFLLTDPEYAAEYIVEKVMPDMYCRGTHNALGGIGSAGQAGGTMYSKTEGITSTWSGVI